MPVIQSRLIVGLFVDNHFFSPCLNSVLTRQSKKGSSLFLLGNVFLPPWLIVQSLLLYHPVDWIWADSSGRKLSNLSRTYSGFAGSRDRKLCESGCF